MAATSLRDTTSFRVSQGGAAMIIDTELNILRHTNTTGNIDARIDATSVPGLSDEMDTFRIRLDLSQVAASFWVATNEYKFGIFDNGFQQYSIWVIGTAGAPSTLEIRDNSDVLTTVSYDPAVHRHLGHRWDSVGGNWHWEYSTDGITWADLHSASLQASFDPDDIQIIQLRLENSANATSIGHATVSCLNAPAPTAHAWPGFIKGIDPSCRSESPVITELSAATAFRVKFKVDAEVFHRVVADQSKIDLLIPLSDLSTKCVSVRVAWASGTLVNVQLRTPDDSVQEVNWDVAANAPPAGEFVYFDVGQLGTDMWLRMAPQFGSTLLIDQHDAAATAFGGITNPGMVMFPTVGDDVGLALADDDAAPLRIGAISLITPSGTPWTATADQIRETGTESGLIEHWPCNDGKHFTVVKGAEGNYDINFGEGATFAEDYWSLPSSRPLLLDSLPANMTRVRNVSGTDTPDTDAGVFEGGVLKQHRDGFETTQAYRLNNDLYEIDFEYGGEWQIEAVTAQWPTAIETADFDGQPASLRDAAATNILGIRVGYEPGTGQQIEQNATLNGSAITPANRAVITNTKSNGPWRMRIRVEGTAYYVDYLGLGTATKTWAQAGSAMTLSSVRSRFAALKGRRSSKNNQGTAFGPSEYTAWKNEQIAGPTAAATPTVYTETATERIGGDEAASHLVIYVENAIDSFSENEAGTTALVLPATATERMGSVEVSAALVVYPATASERTGPEEIPLDVLVLPVTATERVGTDEGAPETTPQPATAAEQSGTHELAPTAIIFPVTAVERLGTGGAAPIVIPTGPVSIAFGWYLAGAGASPTDILRYGEQVAGRLEGRVGEALSVRRYVVNLPAGRAATEVRLKVRVRLSGTPLIEKVVTTTPTVDGAILEDGSGVGDRVALEVILSAADTTSIGTRTLFYDLEIEDDAAVVTVPELGVTDLAL